MSRDEWFAMFQRSTLRLILDGDLTISEVVGGWVAKARCRLRGHQWEDFYDYLPDAGIGRYYQGSCCQRCQKMSYDRG